eukprot:1157249-Pelagomonas_calceolata.AAC.8
MWPCSCFSAVTFLSAAIAACTHVTTASTTAAWPALPSGMPVPEASWAACVRVCVRAVHACVAQQSTMHILMNELDEPAHNAGTKHRISLLGHLQDIQGKLTTVAWNLEHPER